jgi:hypothetical protein
MHHSSHSTCAKIVDVVINNFENQQNAATGSFDAWQGDPNNVCSLEK